MPGCTYIRLAVAFFSFVFAAIAMVRLTKNLWPAGYNTFERSEHHVNSSKFLGFPPNTTILAPPLARSLENSNMTWPNLENISLSTSLGEKDPLRLLRLVENPYLATLLKCSTESNPYNGHIRIANIVQNVHQMPAGASGKETQNFNPTIIALPYWSNHRYLLVSRVVTEGLHQESHICEADICTAKSGDSKTAGDLDCTADDIANLGHSGGLRCATETVIVEIPATPAELCEGVWSTFPDIPGFHDPRVFWSGRGEPLIIVNSASQFACLGLWILDLRVVYKPLEKLLGPQESHASPPVAYKRLTELTRNPASSRSPVEKNWFLFFPTKSTAYIHYDLSPPAVPVTQANMPTGRTIAKLLRDGYTTPNLTDAQELPCLSDETDPSRSMGHWHQATNSLKLILCYRSEAEAGTCHENDSGRAVHFAIIHRKFSNALDLPLRYERYFVVWDAKPPFSMLAISKHPILLYNETASGWSGHENWAIEMQNELRKKLEIDHHMRMRRDTNSTNQTSVNDAWVEKDQVYGPPRENWAYFTYTPSIAWAWRPGSVVNSQQDKGNPFEGLQVGYLDEEVILGIGLDDRAQGFARVKAETLLQCMRACPGKDLTTNTTGLQEEGEERERLEKQYELFRHDSENRDLIAAVE